MRFAWLRDNERPARAVQLGGSDRVVLIAYNLVWWLPIPAAVFGAISYDAGFVCFLLITAARAAVNGYRVNVLPVERGIRFPLRSP